MIQQVFKAGNSNVIAIPTATLKDLDLKTGDQVFVEKISGSNALVIKKYQPENPQNTKTSQAEFKKWLKVFMKENGEILDELALR